MSETTETNVGAADGQAGNGAQRAGALLKAARESAGVHIAAMAVGLKVPVKKLEALEAGQLDALSSPVFVRALASSVCRNLKVDPSEILALLPQVAAAPLAQPHELNTPFRVPGERAGGASAMRLLNAPVMAVLALLLGALALALWPHDAPLTKLSGIAPMDAQAPGGAMPASATPAEPAVQTGTSVSPVVPVTKPQAGAPVTPATTSAAAVAAAPTASAAAMPAAARASAALVSSSAAVGSIAMTASAPVRPVSAPLPRISAGPAVAGEAGLVQFKVSSASWIEVVDVKGEVLLRRSVEPGEPATVKGTMPLRVVVGRADVTEVHVRGRKVDMKAIAQGNVARFEVEP